MKVSVTGAGGFIGHHLVSRLKMEGHWVKGIDLKPPEYESSRADRFEVRDLRTRDGCCEACAGADWVFHLAANMGGIGFIESHRAEIIRDNTRIDMEMLEAARYMKVGRFLYTSSACVYPMWRQAQEFIEPLKEEDAYPAQPEDGYGWEKLYAERLCRHYREEMGVETRVVRFHNIYGPLGTYDGGREKSPAAICRKVALCRDGGEIEVWGDGKQTRSYCYIDDCVEGLLRIMRSDVLEPINLGRDDMVSVDGLVGIVAGIAKKQVRKKYDLTKPVGVRGRNADMSLMKLKLGWTPQIPLEIGLGFTYRWIESELRKAGRL